jgi:predicted DNA-binding transcriptional regulator AlpA
MSVQELLTVDQAAAEFGIHRTTLFRAIAKKELPSHTRVGDRRTYVGRWDVQRVVDPPAVTRCLELVYRRFATTGEWPLAIDIQRQLDRDGENYDFLATLETLPQELGWRVRDMQGQAQITLRGIARCANSGEDIAAFLAAVRTCYHRYISEASDLSVKGADLAEEFGFDQVMLNKLHKLLQLEAVFWTSLGAGPQGWELTIDPNRIRYFREVESLSDYLVAKDRAFQPASRLQWPVVFSAAGPPPEHEPALHPSIAKAMGTKPVGASPTAAVMAAAAGFERFVAERLSVDEKQYGQRLVNTYFDTALRVGHPNPRRVESLRSIVLGAVGAYRNPTAHGRQEFNPEQAHEIVALFSLMAREVEELPMPQVFRWASYREMSKATIADLAGAGHRRGVLQSPAVAKIPESWFCEEHMGFIDRFDLGLTYGGAQEPMPVCPKIGCTSRGWERVHPMDEVRSTVAGSGGQLAPKVRQPRVKQDT